MKIEQIEKLNEERTKGEYKTCAYKGSTHTKHTKIVSVFGVIADTDRSFNDERELSQKVQDASFIAACPAIASQYIRARRFEVTDEFVLEVLRTLYCPWEDVALRDIVRATLQALWTEIEGGENV